MNARMNTDQHRPPPVTIGKVDLGRVPRIAVPLTDEDVEGRVATAVQWADIIEARVDMFASVDEAHVVSVCQQVRANGAPLLVTIRCPRQGGQGNLGNQQRLDLYRAVAPIADAVDIEVRSPIFNDVLAAAAEHDLTTIASHHDFEGTPDDLELRAIAAEARSAGATIVKIATTANNDTDRNRMLDLLRQRGDQPMIAIAMGAHGAASRVFFPLCGSLITYGFLGKSVAPGQLSIEALRKELQRYCPELTLKEK